MKTRGATEWRRLFFLSLVVGAIFLGSLLSPFSRDAAGTTTFNGIMTDGIYSADHGNISYSPTRNTIVSILP